MIAPVNNFENQRVYSLDVFRGLTIFLMVFVNEVAGIRDLPQAFYHLPGNVDGMTMVDWVFAGFLFIVGMSIPFALNHRIKSGDDQKTLLMHILLRTFGLLVLGVFMVNAEGGHHEESMLIPKALWALMIYPAAILIWNKYHSGIKPSPWLYRGLGILILVVLAILYRGGEHGELGMTPKWWGILGLIGWAYLFASILYLLSKGKIQIVLTAILLCLAIYILGHIESSNVPSWFSMLRPYGSHATHTCIALSGVVLSLILFETRYKSDLVTLFRRSFTWAGFLFLMGFALRPFFHISKNGATPSWGMYSSMFSVLAFLVIYWIIDIKKQDSWAKIFQPAGANPLLTYIIPFILWALYDLFNFYPLPGEYKTGILGLVYCILYAFFVLWLVRILNKMNIRLQL